MKFILWEMNIMNYFVSQGSVSQDHGKKKQGKVWTTGLADIQHVSLLCD